jgi:UDP-glucose 4-epimerase
MRFPITGGTGFVVSHLVDALLTTGNDALALDNLSTGRLGTIERPFDTGQVDFVDGPLLDAQLAIAAETGGELRLAG